ncbi:hypothetical protein Ddc_16590 [Ditylenchus destructor]|nr:hypothetical protein Ddc_16590 [Ditylenchus destructor]
MQLSRLSKEESIQLQQTCGLSVSMAENRITGGGYARRGQFPWAVALAADSAGIVLKFNTESVRMWIHYGGVCMMGGA